MHVDPEDDARTAAVGAGRSDDVRSVGETGRRERRRCRARRRPSIDTSNVGAPAGVTVICGGDANQPDAGGAGVSVTAGPGGGGGVGANPGPLLAAHATLPAPSTTCTTTRICSLAIAAGTASVPTNDAAAWRRGRGSTSRRPPGTARRRGGCRTGRRRRPTRRPTCRPAMRCDADVADLRRGPVGRGRVVDVARHAVEQHLRAGAVGARRRGREELAGDQHELLALGDAVGSDQALRRRWRS